MGVGLDILGKTRSKENLVGYFANLNPASGGGWFHLLNIQYPQTMINKYPLWVNTNNYVVGNLVSFSNYLYLCLQNNIGNAPSSSGDTTYWHKVINITFNYVITVNLSEDSRTCVINLSSTWSALSSNVTTFDVYTANPYWQNKFILYNSTDVTNQVKQLWLFSPNNNFLDVKIDRAVEVSESGSYEILSFNDNTNVPLSPGTGGVFPFSPVQTPNLPILLGASTGAINVGFNDTIGSGTANVQNAIEYLNTTINSSNLEILKRVRKAGDTMTGALTMASASATIVGKGVLGDSVSFNANGGDINNIKYLYLNANDPSNPTGQHVIGGILSSDATPKDLLALEVVDGLEVAIATSGVSLLTVKNNQVDVHGQNVINVPTVSKTDIILSNADHWAANIAQVRNFILVSNTAYTSGPSGAPGDYQTDIYSSGVYKSLNLRKGGTEPDTTYSWTNLFSGTNKTFGAQIDVRIVNKIMFISGNVYVTTFEALSQPLGYVSCKIKDPAFISVTVAPVYVNATFVVSNIAHLGAPNIYPNTQWAPHDTGCLMYVNMDSTNGILNLSFARTESDANGSANTSIIVNGGFYFFQFDGGVNSPQNLSIKIQACIPVYS